MPINNDPPTNYPTGTRRLFHPDISQRKVIGMILIVFSALGIGIFSMLKINPTIFYLSFGWGLGMLI